MRHLVLVAAAFVFSLLLSAEVPHEAELRVQTSRLIEAFEMCDVDAVIGMVAKSGISVGVGAEKMKQGEFAKSMRKHSQIYCSLMDDHCLENRRYNINAMVDGLHSNPKLMVMPIEGHADSATVTSSYGTHESEFDFVLEDGVWKLNHLEWN